MIGVQRFRLDSCSRESRVRSSGELKKSRQMIEFFNRFDLFTVIEDDDSVNDHDYHHRLHHHHHQNWMFDKHR